MTEFLISHMNEIIDDDNSIQYAQFEGKKIVPTTDEPPAMRGNKESYYANI